MKTIKLVFLFLPWVLLLLALLLWALGVKLPGQGTSKTEVIESTVILEKIERMGKLELVKFNFKEIYDYQSISEGKITGSSALKTYDYTPDLKAVLIASGEAVGCIDLTRLQKEDISLSKDTLIVHLPRPELCYHKLDLDKTRLYEFERTGWWSRMFGDDNEMKTVVEKAYKNAEVQIKKAALENGILEQTEENAIVILKPMLENLSGRKVVILFDISGYELEMTD